jgi:micrococcal nuclease
MNTKKTRSVVVVVLCVCGIVASVGLSVWVSGLYGHSNSGTNQRRYVSWAEKVNVDPHASYEVVEVVDGDTLKASIEGHLITIRLLGINTPEVLDPRKPVECYGPEASAESKSLLTGKDIFIALNQNYDRIDKYGRLLAYVRIVSQPVSSSSTVFLNEFLIKEGYAREYTFNEKNPYQYQGLFRADELEAKKAGKGLWGKCL